MGGRFFWQGGRFFRPGERFFRQGGRKFRPGKSFFWQGGRKFRLIFSFSRQGGRFFWLGEGKFWVVFWMIQAPRAVCLSPRPAGRWAKPDAGGFTPPVRVPLGVPVV